MSISVNPNELYIEPGIVMRKNFNNHQLTHEMLHGITSKNIILLMKMELLILKLEQKLIIMINL